MIYNKSGDFMKQFLSVLLSAALLFSLVGCGNSATNSSSSNDKNSSAQSEEKASSDTENSSEQSTSSNFTPPKKTVKFTEPEFPATTEDVYSGQLVKYELNNECKGYYFTPKAKGKYPTVILIHGAGGVGNFKDKLLSSINDWVKKGYIKPMVVIIPEVLDYTGGGTDMQDFQYYISAEYPKRFGALLTSIEKGTLSSQIDTSIMPYVAGFSMGGMAAIYAGAQHNTRIKHVGGLSPSQAFYLGEDHELGFYKHASDIYFSTEPDAKVYLSAGRGEQSGAFVDNIDRYRVAIQVNNPNITSRYTAPATWGDHGFELAKKEIFMYLCLASCDKLPKDDVVLKVCDGFQYKMPTIVEREEEHK